MRKISCIIICLLLTFNAFGTSDKFKTLNERYPIIKISEENEVNIKSLLTRNFFQAKGPMACPLKLNTEISGLASIGFKMESLKKACLAKGEGLDGNASFDDMISNANELGGNPEAAAGIGALGSIMGGLGALSKRSCIKGAGTLEVFISIFSTLLTFSGFIPGQNGLAISGVSSGLLSTLLLVDGLMKKAWNFNDIAQRQNFIKLTCSFFELRQELNASGLLNIPTAAFRADCGLNDDMIEYLEDLKEQNKEQLVKIENELKLDLDNFYKKDLKSAYFLEMDLVELLPNLKTPVMESGSPSTQKMKVINELTLKSAELLKGLESYMNEAHPSVGFFDQMLLKELAKLDYSTNPEDFETLFKMEPLEFDKGYRSTLLFHFERILNDISENKKILKANWELTYKSENDDLNGSIEKRNKETREYLVYLEKRKRVLRRIQNSCSASLGLDAELFGRGALIDIMANFNCLKSELAAKTAFKFVDFSTKASWLAFKKFNMSFDGLGEIIKFNPVTGKYEYAKDLSAIGTFEKVNLCQKGVNARASWIEATGNIDQTVGYVKSISDLLVMPKFSLYSSRPEHERRDFLMTKGEKLRRHLHSIQYAEQKLEGKTLDADKTKKVLNKSYAGNLLLEKHSSRAKMNAVQDLMTKLSCDNIGLSFGTDGGLDLGDVDVDLGGIGTELPGGNIGGSVGGSTEYETDPVLSEDISVGIEL